MKEIKRIQFSKIRRGPVRHEQLPAATMAKIKRAYEVAAHYTWGGQFEEWEADFLRDVHPDREAEVWLIIADAVILYQVRHNGNQPLSNELGREVCSNLTAISLGFQNPPPDFSKQVWDRCCACWETVARGIERAN